MSHLQDLGKVASGLAMVVKESMKRAPNVGNTALDVLKAVTGTVTDLTGLTQGRVKDVRDSDLGHRRKETPTSAAARESYLLNTLDSLGPPRRPVSKNRTDEVLARVKEDILPSVAESPMSKPLENFTPVGASSPPVRKEEETAAAKLDSEAIKAEQVVQASRIGGAFSVAFAVMSLRLSIFKA